MIWLLFQFILAFLILNKSADWFARGTAMVAELTGMPRIWMGAILAGFVASIPEKVVSAVASWSGHSDIALGNSIGSVTFNCVLLGIVLLRAHAVLEKAWFRDHGLPMLILCLILFGFCLRDSIGWGTGVLFILLCAFYIVWSVFTARRDPHVARVAEEAADEAVGTAGGGTSSWAVALLLLGISCPVVFLSSVWAKNLTVDLARLAGLSESVISLTLVAIGTSLPELATTLAALRRGHVDTTLGLIFGSNIFVGMGAVGISALCGPLQVSAANRLFDLPVMMAVTILPFLPLAWGRVPGRVMGAALLVAYGVYAYALFTFYGVFQ